MTIDECPPGGTKNVVVCETEAGAHVLNAIWTFFD